MLAKQILQNIVLNLCSVSHFLLAIFVIVNLVPLSTNLIHVKNYRKAHDDWSL